MKCANWLVVAIAVVAVLSMAMAAPLPADMALGGALAMMGAGAAPVGRASALDSPAGVVRLFETQASDLARYVGEIEQSLDRASEAACRLAVPLPSPVEARSNAPDPGSSNGMCTLESELRSLMHRLQELAVKAQWLEGHLNRVV